jgi:hypothetical protein
MFVTKLGMATVALLAVGVIGLTATVIPYRALASGQVGATNDAAPKPTAKGAEKPKAESGEKGKKAEFITTAGTHKLWGGKWSVEVTRVEVPKGPLVPANVPKDRLRVEFTRPDGKWIVFNDTFSEKWPWFVYAPSPDMAMFYDGDRVMNLLTISDKGSILSRSVILPKEWVDELKKLRPAQAIQVQDIGPDGKIRMRPLRPGERLPERKEKEGEVEPPPDR